VKPSSSANPNDYRRIVSKDRYVSNSDRGGWALYLLPNNDPTYPNRVAFSRYNGTTGATEVWGATTLANWTWYHVAATYDGTTMRLYVNGQLDGSGGSTVSVQNHTFPLKIGGRSNGANHFGGWIDDVGIYSTALTATQIQLHYDSGRQ
jgi:hypothetical protein